MGVKFKLPGEFAKVGGYSFLSTMVKMLLSLTIVKVSAIWIGRENFSIIFQFVNVIAIFTITSIAAMDVGIVRLVAENHDNKEKLHHLKNLIIGIVVAFTCMTSITLMLFSKQFSNYFFASDKYACYIRLLSFFIFFQSFNKVFLAYTNGLKQFELYYRTDIITSILSILSFTLLTIYFGISGAIISYFIVPCIITVLLLWRNLKTMSGLNLRFNMLSLNCRRDFNRFLRKTRTSLKNNNSTVKLLASFSLLALASSFMGPFVESLIRQELIREYSTKFSAIWDALNKFSGLYIVFFSSLINAFFIPHFIGIKNTKELSTELKKIFFIITPTLTVISILVLFFKDGIIMILFSKEFEMLGPLIGYQLAGTVFSVFNIILQAVIVSKLNPLYLILYNLVIYITYFLFVVFLVKYFKGFGLPLSYLANSILGFAILVFTYRWKLSSKMNSNGVVEKNL